MIEIYFLLALGFLWILFATIQDIRTSEIANWLNFSLIIFALGFRFFYGLFEAENFYLFYQGLIGLLIFFGLSQLFYYGKMFAGGDASLMFALGAILPVYSDFFSNLNLFILFILIFLIIGAIYGLFASFYIGLKNWKKLKKEFKNQFSKSKKIIFLGLILACVFLIFGFYFEQFFYLGVLSFLLPYLFLYAKSVDESCMVKRVPTNKLSLGDWLYEDVKVGNKVIKANWDGLQKKDIALLKKKKFVRIRYGVQFAPVFLISFLLLIIFIYKKFSLF